MSVAVQTAQTVRRQTGQAALLAAAGLTLAACVSTPAPAPVAAGPETRGQPTSRYNGYKVGQPYQVRGVWYYPKAQPDYDQIGIASWYGDQFHNHYTADGEVFDMHLPSAAHTTLPLPSLVEVTNLANGRTLVVRVNDRGPFVDGRIIDLSKEAATELGFMTAGVTKVRVRYIGQAADPPGFAPRQQIAAAGRAAAKSDPLLALASPAIPPSSQKAPGSARPAPYQAAPAAMAQAQPPQPAPAQKPLSDVDALLADDARPASPPAAQSAPATYELQAGTFSSEAAAWHFASSLTGGGLPEVQTVRNGGQTTWRVVVHGLANPAEAAAARSEAMALGAPNIAIVAGS
jgi:rare lipoprotein A